MKATKFRNSKGELKGAFVYSVKKNGELYKNPSFIQYYGGEKTPADVVARMKKLNPNSDFVAAENQEACEFGNIQY